ncbi:D-alanyl-D-alanine carboxypeptidase family protein [Fredinandcohnia humi]
MKKVIILLIFAGVILLFIEKGQEFLNESKSIQFELFNDDDEVNRNLPIAGNAAILLDAESGELLYGKNSDKKIYPASTTKIMTALLAIEKGNLDDIIRVGDEVNMKLENESTAWLVEGRELSLRALLAGLMLPSGNDAARTIAIHIAKKESGNMNLSNKKAMAYFAKMMNERAREIGAKNTNFVNPHGLHDDDHYTTAFDLGLIAKEAMKNTTFQDIVSEHKYVDSSISYVNRNKLLDPTSGFYYEGANGIKTGFTDEAGYCLISAAKRNDKQLLAVVLQSTDVSVWNDSITLLDHGFAKVIAAN